MNGVGFEILDRTPVPKLHLSYPRPPPTPHPEEGVHLVKGAMANLACDPPLFSEKNDNKEKVAYGQVSILKITLNTEDRCSHTLYGSVLV